MSEAIVAKTIKRSLVFLAAENDHVVAIPKKDRQRDKQMCLLARPGAQQMMIARAPGEVR